MNCSKYSQEYIRHNVFSANISKKPPLNLCDFYCIWMKNPSERIMAMLARHLTFTAKPANNMRKTSSVYNYYRRYIALRSFGFITQRRPPYIYTSCLRTFPSVALPVLNPFVTCSAPRPVSRPRLREPPSLRAHCPPSHPEAQP